MFLRFSTFFFSRMLATFLPNQNPLFNISSTERHLVFLISSAANSVSLPSADTGSCYHSTIIKLGLVTNPFVSTALLNLYSKCHQFHLAQKLFDHMPQKTVVTYNTLMYCYSKSHLPFLSITLLCELIDAGISMTLSTVSSVLVAGARLGDIRIGKMLHCVGFKQGFCNNVVVGTGLVDVYAKCGDLTAAREVFDCLHERNVITYTSLITGYALQQKGSDAIMVIRHMCRCGVELNQVSYNSVLNSFSSLEDLVHGKQVHCLVIKVGFCSEPYIVVTLLSMYSRCGSLDDFVNTCGSIQLHDQIMCNSIIAGYSNLGEGAVVLKKFHEMRRAYIYMDFFTFTSVLGAVGTLSALQEGRQVHCLIVKSGFESNSCIQNGLLSMYSKCGELEDSKRAFLLIVGAGVVSWNALISGFAQHGYGREAVELFEQMQRTGLRPNATTFLSVLTACSHVGLVDEGLKYFSLMKQGDTAVIPEREHYACVVDLLCRAGRLHDAESLINSMPLKPGLSVYKTLLSSCQAQANLEIASRVAERSLQLYPCDTASYVLLSNALAAKDYWVDATGVREMMGGKGLRKQPAWSCIDDSACVP